MLGREIMQPIGIMMGVAENQQPQFPSDYVEELEEVDPIARENLHNAQMRLSLHDSFIKIYRAKKIYRYLG